MRFVTLLVLAAFCLPAETTLLEGRKIFYRQAGKGPITLALIHGWSCDHTFLDAQFTEFQKTHHVISLDLPGHGQSESPKALTMQSFVDALEAVRQATKSNALVLVGHSMGSIVAREYTRKYPKLVHGMVFLDGSIFQLPPGGADRDRWSEGITRLANSFGPGQDQQVRERAVSVFLSNMYSDETPRELRMSILRKVLTTAPETSRDAMMAMADLKLWDDQVQAVPVLALRAGRQKPPAEEVYLKGLFPKVQYKFMPGLSHFLMMEAPAQVNEEIRLFLKASKLL